MADTFWGENPEELTVEASPTPTNTVFTVSSATNLLVDQYILVEVASAYQRAQITNIAGNALTVTGLSGAPDTPGSVINSRELIKRDMLNSSALLNASSPAELKVVDITRAPNGLKYLVNGHGIYTYRSASTESNDVIRNRYIKPTSGPGCWVLTQAAIKSIPLYPGDMALPDSAAATRETDLTVKSVPQHGMRFGPSSDTSAWWSLVVPADFGDDGIAEHYVLINFNATVPEQTNAANEDVRWFVWITTRTASNLAQTVFLETHTSATEGETWPLFSNVIQLGWLGSPPSPGDLIYIKVTRDADSAFDTVPDDAILLPCELIYTTEIAP